MILIKDLKFFYVLRLSKLDREKVFADVLDRKEGFKEWKNLFLWKPENYNLS